MLNPSSTTVPFWGQSPAIPSVLSPKRDCGTKRVKKEGTADPGNYGGIRLLRTLDICFCCCKILDDRTGTVTEEEDKTSEGQAGFGPNRSCVDHAHALGKVLQGRMDAGLTACCFFIDVQKEYGNMVDKSVAGKVVGNRDQRKDRCGWKTMNNVTECARSK